MLKIWGRSNSLNVQKVMWTVGELGIAHERLDVGGRFGGLDRPAYLRMNPNAKIPTIDDDWVIVWESNAVVRYLAAPHGADRQCDHHPRACGPPAVVSAPDGPPRLPKPCHGVLRGPARQRRRLIVALIA